MGRLRIKRQKAKPRRRELRLDELKSILDRARDAPLSADDYSTLSAAVDTLAFLTQELEAKGTTIDRLRRLIFGASTEKTSQVVPEPSAAGGTTASAPGAGVDGARTDGTSERKRPPGHGRNGAAAYVGAQKVKVPHASLKAGDACPECDKGKLYRLDEPAVIVRVKGMTPLSATVYERERLRCKLCGEVFVADAPEGIGSEKYDETAASMIGLFKYGCGLPFNRIERLERGMGIPLPAATQWEVVHRAAGLMAPAYEELIRQAAQGRVLHNDDTTMKILDLVAEQRRQVEADEEADERTGVFTSGIVSMSDGRQIALFFTGRQHAGENLAQVLERRAAELDAPIQMCDALASNTAGVLDTIVANCLAHGRRQFVDVANNFPDECRFVLETLKAVYANDAAAREQKMSDEERLRFHQTESAPAMQKLQAWMHEQLDERKVEPNSGLGEAIGYMIDHWPKLTLFLERPGAPLDNNICERALKKAILHRKNSYFYKTQNGARVGDLFMSLVHTAELCGASPFDYMVALQRHHEEVARSASDWMPWNYQQALAHLTGPDPPV